MDKNPKINLHGVGVSILGCGVLIIGESGIGKSELALSLIDHGHKFVVDDSILIEKLANNELIMSAINFAEPFMHVRGIGFINIARMYNNFTQVLSSSKVDLVVELCSDDLLLDINPIQPLLRKHNILDIDVTKFILPIGNNRSLALLVETMVRYYIQLQNGYDATYDFTQRHTNMDV